MIRVSNLTKNYGAVQALCELDLTCRETTRCLALIGPSGGGKSTLLRQLGGLEVPDHGKIEVLGKVHPQSENDLQIFRRKNGFLFQAYNLFPHLTAMNNLILPLVEVHGKTPADARKIALSHLERFNLAEKADAFPNQLSGGQQQRIALIRALAAQPELLFLDEPTAALDPEMTVEVLELIQQLVQNGQRLVVCTHEMGFAKRVADEVAFIASGKMLEINTPEQLFHQPKHPDVLRFLNRMLEFS